MKNQDILELETNRLISNTFKEHVDGMLDEIFESKTFIISMYLLKYLYDNDLKYWNKFIDEFSKLDYEDKIQVLMNVAGNLKVQKKNKEEKPKVKKK